MFLRMSKTSRKFLVRSRKGKNTADAEFDQKFQRKRFSKWREENWGSQQLKLFTVAKNEWGLNLDYNQAPSQKINRICIKFNLIQ